MLDAGRAQARTVIERCRGGGSEKVVQLPGGDSIHNIICFMGQFVCFSQCHLCHRPLRDCEPVCGISLEGVVVVVVLVIIVGQAPIGGQGSQSPRGFLEGFLEPSKHPSKYTLGL